MAVITSSVAMIIFVAAEITYKINMSEKSCWYSLKNVVNCSNGGRKYKFSALLYISYFTEIKDMHPLKVLDSNFQLISMLYIF